MKEERTPGGELQFQTEVEMISMAVHRNLLRLRGFCMTPTERLLVYPYMANGSVASCLRGKTWKHGIIYELVLTAFDVLFALIRTLSSTYDVKSCDYRKKIHL